MFGWGQTRSLRAHSTGLIGTTVDPQIPDQCCCISESVWVGPKDSRLTTLAGFQRPVQRSESQTIRSTAWAARSGPWISSAPNAWRGESAPPSSTSTVRPSTRLRPSAAANSRAPGGSSDATAWRSSWNRRRCSSRASALHTPGRGLRREVARRAPDLYSPPRSGSQWN